ncbi:hypothetical protein E4U42_000339 [Claviceps africana]|uniref:Zn(2)-C6 fungal-type domain-containing protein n=1 Tax=Claviceps africana TaxID=83212 RepID=A0A8K0NFL4_9HYPO|nr:hypothetical protein E4U42_000339 [Claviceps africana]
MEQNFRRLLPRRSPSPLTYSNESEGDRSAAEGSRNWGATASGTGRRAVRAACEPCRRQKCKCDARRPSCSHCLRRRAECIYITDSGETHGSALRRRYSSQEEELDSLKKLLRHIRTGSSHEVDKIILHIRSYEDPIEAFNSYVCSTEGQSLAAGTMQETDRLSDIPIDPQLGPASEAWNTLGIAVPAEPGAWTTIAPVDVVHDLVSRYFFLERPVLLPSIDHQSFAEEMNRGDTSSEMYCSDLLVNAICAHQCFLSEDYTQSSVSQRDLGRKFLDECYRLLRLRTGRITLPSAQAVTLIYQAELAEQLFNIPIQNVHSET